MVCSSAMVNSGEIRLLGDVIYAWWFIMVNSYSAVVK